MSFSSILARVSAILIGVLISRWWQKRAVPSDFGSLRVWVTRDGSHFVCQGLEVDYLAEGQSVEEALANFHRGLLLTLKKRIEKYKHPHTLIQPAPREHWKEAFDNLYQGLARLQAEPLDDFVSKQLLFRDVVFIVDLTTEADVHNDVPQYAS